MKCNDSHFVSEHQSTESNKTTWWNFHWATVKHNLPCNLFSLSFVVTTSVVVVVLMEPVPGAAVSKLPRRTCLHPGHASVIVRTAEVRSDRGTKCFIRLGLWDLRH